MQAEEKDERDLKIAAAKAVERERVSWPHVAQAFTRILSDEGLMMSEAAWGKLEERVTEKLVRSLKAPEQPGEGG